MSDQKQFSVFESLVFPKFSLLGPLEIVEVFQFYDVPLCFLSRNRAGSLFLSTLYDLEDETRPSWYLLPVSVIRFQEIRSGSMDLHTAFLSSETELIYTTNSDKIEPHSVFSLDALTFPIPNSRLELKTPTRQNPISSLASYAASTMREAIDLSFENPRFRTTVLPIRQLGQHLKAFQEVVDTIPFDRAQNTNTRGRIPQASLSETELGFVENYAASFGVRMVSLNALPFLWGNSTLDDCLNKLFDLLDISNNPGDLSVQLSAFSSRTIGKYINFLKTLTYTKTSIKASFVASRKQERKAALTSAQADLLIPLLTKIVEEEPLDYEIEGMLIGLVVNTRTFVVQYQKDGKTKTISGPVLDTHLSDASYATINENYIFTIRETESYNVVNDESKIKYALLQLRKPN